MRRPARARTLGLILLGAVLACALAGAALAWSSPTFRKHVVAGGGGRSAGGGFLVQGTIGQPSTGTAAGGSYALAGGFWPGAGGAPPEPTGSAIYLPLVVRSAP